MESFLELPCEIKILYKVENSDKIISKVMDGELIMLDRDIGLTITKKNDPNTYIICWHGPSSPKLTKEIKLNMLKEFTQIYNVLFDYVETAAKTNGVIDLYLIESLFPGILDRRKLTEEDCAFS